MHVLHVISGLDPENGGPTFALIGLAEAQVRAGMDVRVLATWQITSGFPYAERLRSNGVPVTLIGQARGKLSRHPDLAAATDRAVAEADVVHIHALWEQVQHEAAVAARRRGVPYVVTPHGMLSPWSRSQGKWFNRWGKRLYLAVRLRRNLNAAAALHFTTDLERDWASPLRLHPPAIVEPVGIDFTEFETLPQKGAFRSKHSHLAGRKIVTFLGRLHPGKGMEYLVPAMARLRDQSAMLVAVGPDSGGFRATLEHRIDALGLRDRVLLTGMLRGRDRLEALVDADLFALPSDHESFGVSVVEALACGTPVVVSRGVAIHPELVAAGVGSAVSSDPQALAGELDRWLADAPLRRVAGERGRAFVRERYDWPRIARRWVEHYAALAPSRAAEKPTAAAGAAP